jgi:hypothetical protein
MSFKEKIDQQYEKCEKLFRERAASEGVTVGLIIAPLAFVGWTITGTPVSVMAAGFVLLPVSSAILCLYAHTQFNKAMAELDRLETLPEVKA